MTVEDMEALSRDPNGNIPLIPRASEYSASLRIGWAQTAEICKRQEEIILLLSSVLKPKVSLSNVLKPKVKKKGFFG